MCAKLLRGVATGPILKRQGKMNGWDPDGPSRAVPPKLGCHLPITWRALDVFNRGAVTVISPLNTCVIADQFSPHVRRQNLGSVAWLLDIRGHSVHRRGRAAGGKVVCPRQRPVAKIVPEPG